MKAWRISKHGSNEVLKWIDLPMPEPGPLEVRVKVEAVGLNHLDVWVRKGVPGHTFPLPITPGCDIAGTIDHFGPGAEKALSRESLVLGSPVLISPGISCGRCEACLGGFDPLCAHYGILGETQDGGCAEFINVPLQNIIARPKELSASQAAAIQIPFLTAWTMLMRKAEIRAADTVLIQAGGSGVSVAAIQIAKLAGATVITTVGSDEKIQKAKNIGADYIINYKTTPFREELKNILKPLGKKGVDIVIDHVGADTFSDSMKSLAWGGKLILCGATSGSKVEIDLKAVFFKNISIHGSTMGSKADLIRIIELMRQGKLKPVIDSEHAFTDLPKALALLESRKAFGKVVLRAF